MTGGRGLKQEPRAVLQEASRHWYWMPVAVLALGMVSLGLLIATSWIFERLIVQDIARVRVIGEIQRDLSISHLWLEEYVTGDPDVPVEDIERRCQSSMRLSEALLADAPPVSQEYEVRALTDSRLLGLARHLRSRIEQFARVSHLRQEGFERGEREAVGIGTTMDKLYDAIFGDVLDTARELEHDLGSRLASNRNHSRLLLRGILFAWIAIVALAVSGLWTRERRRKLAEEALRQSEAQLLHSQKMDAVGRFAGGLAHDVNNYLAAITAQCELVKRKTASNEWVVAKMDALIASSYKVSSLIQRLLAFSRQQSIQPRVVNLNRVVVDLEKMLERLIGEDIFLESFLSEDLWNVRIDPSQLEQVIVNLLVNARDAMLTGGRMSIETANQRLGGPGAAVERGLSPGDYVMLAVSDTGTGIEKQILDKIFEPFFTTKGKGKAGSSGLGLATVYGIVQQAGGTITVYSEIGLGTTFKIYLPRCRESLEPDALEGLMEPALTGGTERILLVEDNDDLRSSTHAVLEELGYRVQEAESGERGLELFEACDGRFDLVITDVVMPGMSGRDLVGRIQAVRPGIKVLFVSGYTDNVILRHGILEGDVDFLGKPYAIPHLTRKLRELLDREPAHEAISVS